MPFSPQNPGPNPQALRSARLGQPAAAGRPGPYGPGPDRAGPGRRGTCRASSVPMLLGTCRASTNLGLLGVAGPGRAGPGRAGRSASGPARARGFQRQAGSGCGASPGRLRDAGLCPLCSHPSESWFFRVLALLFSEQCAGQNRLGFRIVGLIENRSRWVQSKSCTHHAALTPPLAQSCPTPLRPSPDGGATAPLPVPDSTQMDEK